MGYHFDGLAAVMKFTFKLTDKEGMNNGPHIEYLVKAYESEAYTGQVVLLEMKQVL